MAYQTPIDVIHEFQAQIDALREVEIIDSEQYLDLVDELNDIAEGEDMTGYTLCLCRDGWHFYSPDELVWEHERQAEQAMVFTTADEALQQLCEVCA